MIGTVVVLDNETPPDTDDIIGIFMISAVLAVTKTDWLDVDADDGDVVVADDDDGI